MGLYCPANASLWKRYGRAGFTLIEILILVVIIAVAAVMADHRVDDGKMDRSPVEQRAAHLGRLQAVEVVVLFVP